MSAMWRSPCTEERRAKISAAMRARSSKRIDWARDLTRLRVVFAAGGYPAVIAAFPDRSEAQIRNAVRRHCFSDIETTHRVESATRGRSVWSDPAFHRRFLEALTDRTQFA